MYIILAYIDINQSHYHIDPIGNNNDNDDNDDDDDEWS
jgi:hypothetical protein